MKTLTILSILLFVLSCKQEKKHNRYLDGDWRIVTLKVTEASGIGDFVTSTGEMKFTHEKKSKVGSYNFDINYEYKNTNYSIIETGTYAISKENIILTSSVGNETEAELSYVNKEDLEFIIPNLNNKNIYFVMKKN